MSTPFLSIIVPVYNVEPYLACCLDSILAQTFTDFEVLLIDDGSTDASGTICDDYAKKDSRIRCFHKENGGHTSARQAGFRQASGKYITFVDSDDWIAPS
ncbi:MAG: glycosyltransferase, partial [Lachnospiraceae bacterium]|nr:glycosyltransferase [Lachnospiraceae bacterium]